MGMRKAPQVFTTVTSAAASARTPDKTPEPPKPSGPQVIQYFTACPPPLHTGGKQGPIYRSTGFSTNTYPVRASSTPIGW
jgi:hypothetical protein